MVPQATQKEQTCTFLSEFSQKQQKRSVLRIFAVFFHPDKSVTAMGGAEKRFVETLKFFCKRNNMRITILESNPTILTDPEITCEKYTLSSGLQAKGWLGNYAEWIIWTLSASLKGFVLARHAGSKVVFVPNNTLPNLLSGYATAVLLHLPFYAIVHHIDIPFTEKDEEEGTSLFSSYRSMGYTSTVSLAKTLASYISLSILRKAKMIITVSNFTANILERNRIRREDIFVSGNAIEKARLNEAKPCPTQNIYDGVFVGRITMEKGVFDLIKAWKKVVENKPCSKLLIIGNGLELAEVKRSIVAQGLEGNVVIIPICSEKKLYSLLKTSRVFIFPSLLEGWGIAVAEAISCGLPVVAYDIPALREIFGECRSVFLVRTRDIEAMARGVLKVLDRKDMELQQVSIEYAKRFDWKKVTETDLEAIENIEKRRN